MGRFVEMILCIFFTSTISCLDKVSRFNISTFIEIQTWKILSEILIYFSLAIRLIHIYFKIYVCFWYPYLFPRVKFQCTCTIFFPIIPFYLAFECGFCQRECMHNFTLYLCNFELKICSTSQCKLMCAWGKRANDI